MHYRWCRRWYNNWRRRRGWL